MESPPPSDYSRSLYRAGAYSLGAEIGRLLPRGLLRGLAAFLGRSYARLNPDKAGTLLGRLRRLDGSLDERDAREAFAAFGRVTADYFHLACRTPEEALRLVDEQIGREHLRGAAAHGKGVVVAMPHLGFFELAGLAGGSLGFSTVAVTLPEPSPELTLWRAAYRRRWGMETLELREDPFVLMELARELAAGKFVAALVDRPWGSWAVTVEGIEFSSGPAALSRATGAPLVPSAVYVKENGLYTVATSEPLYPEAFASTEALAERMGRDLLRWIRQRPRQWYQFTAGGNEIRR